MDRETILAEMRVLPEIDSQHEINRRVQFIADTLIEAKSTALILGISGGVDSSTCGRLAQLAIERLNRESASQHFQFIAVRLPYGVQKDEQDAQSSLDFIAPSQRVTVDIKPAADALHALVCSGLNAAGLSVQNDGKLDFAKGNVKARARMENALKAHISQQTNGNGTRRTWMQENSVMLPNT